MNTNIYQRKTPSRNLRGRLISFKKQLLASKLAISIHSTNLALGFLHLSHTFTKWNRECLTVKYALVGFGAACVKFRIVIRITRWAGRDKLPGDVIYTVLLVIIIMGPGQANRNLAIVRVFRGRGKTPIRRIRRTPKSANHTTLRLYDSAGITNRHLKTRAWRS